MCFQPPSVVRPEDDGDGARFKDMLWIVSNRVVTASHDHLPSADMTVFRLDEEELFENLVYQMRRDCPSIVSSSAEHICRAIQRACLSAAL